MKKSNVRIIIAVYDIDQKTNNICIGEGFNLIEAVVRATNKNCTDEELQNIMYVYGDDLEGLKNWYQEQRYILSEPHVLPSENDMRKFMF